MSASVTVRRCVRSESPMFKSSNHLRNGCSASSWTFAPRTYSPVTAESLVGVHCVRPRCVAAQQQGWCEERSLGRTFAHRFEGFLRSVHDLARLREQRDPFGHVGLLCTARERTHLDALYRRIADDDLRESRPEAFSDCVEVLARHDCAADC